jgi:tetratricopeptide (TPR) repeat protein
LAASSALAAEGETESAAARDIAAGRLGAAEERLTEILRKSPGSIEGSYLLGLVQFRTGRLEAARQSFERVVVKDSSHGNAWLLLGMVHAAAGNFDDAASPFEHACRLVPRQSDACYYLGRNEYARSRFDGAAAAFQKAISLRPGNSRAYTGLALVLEAMGRSPEAEASFRKACHLTETKVRPDEDPRIDFGAFLHRQGRLSAAQDALRPVVNEQPRSARAHFELGRVLSALRQDQDAIVMLEKAVAIDGSHYAAHLLLGKLLYRVGRPDEAQKEIALGKQHSPAPPPGGQRP